MASQEVEFAAAETAAMVSNQVFNQVPLPFLRRVIRFDVHISEERIYWVEDGATQVSWLSPSSVTHNLVFILLVAAFNQGGLRRHNP